MFRLLFFVVATALSPFQLQADPIADLLAAAHRKDFAAVGAQIAAAPDRTRQRDLVWALAASDPTTVEFTRSWADSEKDNPVALTARAWSIYWAAVGVRGELSRRRTWPPLLEESARMYRDALALAKQATTLDPRFLPASDALIRLSVTTGDGETALAELDRIMLLDPNRHSLVLTTSALTPAWGGSMGLMEALCGHYAKLVADVPDFDAETCLAQAILRGNVWGNAKDWAISVVAGRADKPFLEREVMGLVRDGELPPEGLSLLSARLRSENRMSVYPILAVQPDPMNAAEPLDVPEFMQGLVNDLSAATQAADRDPGYYRALLDLQALYDIELRSVGLEAMRDPATTDAVREAIFAQVVETEKRHAADLDRRARRLLEISPRSAPSLQFASQHVISLESDPLAADRWALALLTNATVYANYQEKQLGQVVLETKRRYELMQTRIAADEVPSYSASELEEVYLCPYVRAVRLFDEVCANHETGQQYCVMEGILAYPSDSQISYSLYATLADQGICTAERSAPIQSLAYEITDLPPLP